MKPMWYCYKNVNVGKKISLFRTLNVYCLLFRQLTDQLDPHHKFHNEFVEEKVFLSDQTDQNMESLIQNS